MTWRRRTCREDSSCGRSVVVHGETAEQSQAVDSRKRDAADADGQRIQSTYRRGIVLSRFSLVVVNASKVLKGLRLRD